jgi:hypothetical protein
MLTTLLRPLYGTVLYAYIKRRLSARGDVTYDFNFF